MNGNFPCNDTSNLPWILHTSTHMHLFKQCDTPFKRAQETALVDVIARKSKFHLHVAQTQGFLVCQVLNGHSILM